MGGNLPWETIWEKLRRWLKRRTERKKRRVRKLEITLFSLWEYICTEGLAEEARDYLLMNEGNWYPFDIR